MPRKKLTEAQREKLLEDTKQRQRVLQELRTKARLNQLASQASFRKPLTLEARLRIHKLNLKKELIKAKGEKLLEDTKQRQRLLQEARTSARLEQLDYESCEKLGRQLYLEHLELSGELECSEYSTARQYTRCTDSSDSEEDLTDEQSSSSNKKSELETPD